MATDKYRRTLCDSCGKAFCFSPVGCPDENHNAKYTHHLRRHRELAAARKSGVPVALLSPGKCRKRDISWDMWAKEKNIVSADRGCIHWTQWRNNHGYGTCMVNGERMYAHRASFQLFYALKIPTGLCVLHACDNPACVNPHHLFLGTMKDNTQDALRKGRISRAVPDLRHCHTCGGEIEYKPKYGIEQYNKSKFCSESCRRSRQQRHPVPAEFDPLADTWASIIEAQRVIHERGQGR